MGKIKVGVLGATGMVGQRMVSLLESHPWFELTEVAASEKSAGKRYGEAVQGRWKIGAPIPEAAAKLKVKECTPNLDCRLVFSTLDADFALHAEKEFAQAGYIVSSNARSHRMDADVPLLIPEVNPSHLELLKVQRKARGWKGAIVTNPNCTTIGMALALKPIQDAFGLTAVMMTSMQALSGAGYPGVASLDIADNVIPFIGGEEEKVESETLKLLGQMTAAGVEPARMRVSASCNRVNVTDGHTETVCIATGKKPQVEEIREALRSFNPLKPLRLPSSPKSPIVVMDDGDRPQPRLDRMTGNGMSAVVGRLRKCSVLDYKFVVLSHNTIRGAAGGAILNSELLKAKGCL